MYAYSSVCGLILKPDIHVHLFIYTLSNYICMFKSNHLQMVLKCTNSEFLCEGLFCIYFFNI